MTLDRAPWETPTPPVTPTTTPVAPSQIQEFERIINMAEGVMDRLWPKMQKFIEGVQSAKSGRSMEQIQAVDSPQPQANPQQSEQALDVAQWAH